MVDAPTVFVAFAAGFVSFVSPCCLPLVPGYLAAVTGTAPSAVQERRRIDPAVLGRSLVFVGSFSLVFILLGLSATAAGDFLGDNQLTLRRVAGVAIIVMGVLFIASVFVLRLNRDWRPQQLVERAGRGGPVVAGLAFAIAWTPCVGPALGAILGLASTESSLAQGAGLLAVYSAGLAIPFLLTAVGFNAAQRSFAWMKRRFAAIQVAAGTVLVAMGVLVYTNELFRLNIEAQKLLDRWGLNFFQNI
jgi:cytochrome c-type biogenesis protein